MPQQKLYVLLVAVDEYHEDSFRVGDLEGCVNDIEAVETLLKKYYKSLKPRIIKLTNAQATYQNVVEYFQTHLIAHADENTTLLFWFSGHGSRQNTDPMFYKLSPEQKDETLVCHDSRAVANGQMWGQDLADKELAVLIDLAAQKGAEVVTVFDCCHSGSITREGEERPGTSLAVSSFTRQVADRSTFNRSSTTRNQYLQGYYQKHRLATVPEGCHIALSGCQKNETSKECLIDGQKRGIFSYYLQKVLQSNPGISYAHLFEQVKTHVARHQFRTPQTPNFKEADYFNTHRSFLAAQATKSQAIPFEVKYDTYSKEWKIQMGASQGLPQSNQPIHFAIYDNPQLNKKPIAYAAATSVGMLSSGLKLKKGKLKPQKEYWGILLSIPNTALKVNFEGNSWAESRLTKQQAKNGAINFALDATLPHDYKAKFERNKWYLLKNEEELFKENLVGRFVNKLDQIGRWHMFLNNLNNQTHLPAHIFDLTIQGKDTSQKINVNTTRQKGRFKCIPNHTREPQKMWATPYEVVAQNPLSYPVFFTLLYFSPFYGIQVYYNEPVEANSGLFKLIDHKSFNPRDRDQVTSYLQLIVSTQKLQDHFFSQPDVIRDEVRFSEEADEQILRPDDWCTITLEVKLHKA
ncbi:hypothetical protein BKI52_15840 [marine bacterium AO1-C]|nr:hypothetical protein BKI52_15840 [marine bacterium AO1-C]